MVGSPSGWARQTKTHRARTRFEAGEREPEEKVQKKAECTGFVGNWRLCQVGFGLIEGGLGASGLRVRARLCWASTAERAPAARARARGRHKFWRPGLPPLGPTAGGPRKRAASQPRHALAATRTPPSLRARSSLSPPNGITHSQYVTMAISRPSTGYPPAPCLSTASSKHQRHPRSVARTCVCRSCSGQGTLHSRPSG